MEFLEGQSVIYQPVSVDVEGLSTIAERSEMQQLCAIAQGFSVN
jgi:hypothetical protein